MRRRGQLFQNGTLAVVLPLDLRPYSKTAAELPPVLFITAGTSDQPDRASGWFEAELWGWLHAADSFETEPSFCEFAPLSEISPAIDSKQYLGEILTIRRCAL